ncbi:MAG: hypothetical protein JW947_08300 [Sedimentisphaerales bacterium]|nr:hypothetical protein [Sedimentisphaerales bacterium]
MNDNEKQFENFVRGIKFDDNPDYKHRDRLEQELLSSVWKRPRQINIWRTIMKSRISKLAVAAAVLIVALYILIGNSAPTAWAIEQTIEALQSYGAVHMVGTVTDEYGAEKGYEAWMRANKSKTLSKDVIVRITSGVVLWVEDGSTYVYIPQNNTVYFENAVTSGMSQWPGPSLFKMLAGFDDVQTIRGKDPATGREQVTLLCSLISSLGPMSHSFQFDVETKLPVTMTVWNNLDRRGAPSFRAAKITYYEDLPDSLFAVDYPKDAKFVEKELTITESNVGLLADPKYGISTEGLSKEEAACLIIRQTYQAVIDEKLDDFRKLCPTVSSWSDEFLRHLIHSSEPHERVVELVKIDPICKEGFTRLGPIVAVPCIVKTKAGTMREEKMVVQFRNIGGKPSCVLHGPYGLSREIE